MDAQERVGERFANHFFLADLLRETGELAGAKRELEVAISLTLPKRTHRRRISQTVAAFDYVELLALLDQTEKARTFLDQQSQSAKYDHFRQPTIDSILLVFDGQRLILDERFEKAESKFQQAISTLPARRLGFGFFEHRIQRFIARCKQGRHEFDAAEELLLKLEQTNRNPMNALGQLSRRRLVLHLIELYEQWGKQHEAMSWKATLRHKVVAPNSHAHSFSKPE